jgi:hypothetical protein
MDENTKINEQKINDSFRSKTKLHLVLKDKSWRNGFVTEISALFFMFNDNVNGIRPIWYSEIHRVDPYMKEAKDD